MPSGIFVCGATIYKGDATAFSDAVAGTGDSFACAYPTLSPWQSTYFAAINIGQWDGGRQCGRCAMARCVDSRCRVKNKWVQVYLVDQCPTCPGRDLDFSNPAFRELTGLSPDRVTIEWYFTSCANRITGGIQLSPKESGVNEYWQAIFLHNSAEPIASVAIDGKPLKLETYGFWVNSGYLKNGVPHVLTLTSRGGNKLTTTVTSVWRAQELPIQFPGGNDTPMEAEGPGVAAGAPAAAAEASQGAAAAATGSKTDAGAVGEQQPQAAPEAATDGKPAAAGQEQQHAFNPNKKRKVALFMAYVGHGYQGMQRNPGAKSIEDELFRALHAAGAISDANADEHGYMKLHWMRAARTDKGVSAVGQVVSLKMVLEPPGMVERINAALPNQIRVFGYARATNGFDSRKHCDKRRYEYVLPEWVFDPRVGLGRSALVAKAAAQQQAAAAAAEQQQERQQQQEQQQAAGDSSTATAAAADGAAAEPMDAAGAAADAAAEAAPAAGEEQPAADGSQDGAAAAGADPEAAAAAAAGAGGAAPSPAAAAAATPSGPFVFDEACVQRMNEILKNYEGTHNFHNFTIRKPATAPDAKRYMLSFRCPGVFEIGGQRWVRLVVIGQSFMLHQIRKMVGMAVAVMRGTAPETALQLALRTSADLNTPMAPELGLFLDEAYFDGYNKQWGELHGNLSLAPWQADADAFKMDKVYPHIASRDAEESVNNGWLLSLNEANYRFSQWEEQVSRIRAGGGRRTPSRPGSGAAAVIGGMESYGHKRQHSSGGRGGPPHKRGRGSFDGKAGEITGDGAPTWSRGAAAGAAGTCRGCCCVISDVIPGPTEPIKRGGIAVHTTVLFSGSCENGKAAARSLHVKLLGDVRPMFYVPGPRAKSLFGDVYMITNGFPYLADGNGMKLSSPAAPAGTNLAAQFSITWWDVPPSMIGDKHAAAFKAAILRQLPAGTGVYITTMITEGVSYRFRNHWRACAAPVSPTVAKSAGKTSQGGTVWPPGQPADVKSGRLVFNTNIHGAMFNTAAGKVTLTKFMDALRVNTASVFPPHTFGRMVLEPGYGLRLVNEFACLGPWACQSQSLPPPSHRPPPPSHRPPPPSLRSDHTVTFVARLPGQTAAALNRTAYLELVAANCNGGTPSIISVAKASAVPAARTAASALDVATLVIYDPSAAGLAKAMSFGQELAFTGTPWLTTAFPGADADGVKVDGVPLPSPPPPAIRYLPAGRFGGPDADVGTALAVDAVNNTWATGTFKKSMLMGTTNLTAVSSSATDVFVTLLDPTGVAMWASRWGGSGTDYSNALAVSSSGDAVVFGSFSSSGPASFGAISLTSAGNRDTFVAKLSSSGTVLWVIGIGGTGTDEARAACFDAAGDVYVSGTFKGDLTVATVSGNTTLVGAGGTDVFIVKLNGTSGTALWAKSFGGASDDEPAINSLVLGSAGSLYLGGYFKSTGGMMVGTTNLTAETSMYWDAYTISMDASSGAPLWATKLGSGSFGDEFINGMVFSSGSLFLAGTFGKYSTSDGWFALAGQNLTSEVKYDAFAAKLNATSGAALWAVRMGGPLIDEGKNVALVSGDPVVVGTFQNVTTGFASLTTAGGQDVYTARLNGATGATMWVTPLGGTGADDLKGVAVSQANGVEILGSFSNSMLVGTTNLTSAGNTDVFVAALNAGTGAPI
ncbi:tRNA pseudouridine synthase mitochondrial-like [Chlorella sorokiniana]|uniref:tRNA pseudouridine synthase mitochondrial-like n=1 Tax=Chlorella sorokiniana TaxID=3076 RepID=A0A2P6U322_CHLSO|nr:tRNA pseudouridine synthase mitochondrial-like [Chlorella sorokiniana]|eukprot:PRW60709.1 tRNA pseudouridine synthase mitochondrial-like [Chlorella sorokiniana]